jgi:hypothetical protein
MMSNLQSKPYASGGTPPKCLGPGSTLVGTGDRLGQSPTLGPVAAVASALWGRSTTSLCTRHLRMSDRVAAHVIGHSWNNEAERLAL